LSAGQPTGFNPLQLPDNSANRSFLRDWLGTLLQVSSGEELRVVAEAVDACFEHDPAFRRLRHFRELLAGNQRPQEGDLVSRLSPWVGSGEHAWLFDNSEDELDLCRKLIGFDMTALLDNPRLRTPTMLYLFHRIDERLRGEPALILIDEGWKALDDPVFAGRIRDWMKTLRKRNALVGFGTQSARDALESSISSAIVEQTATGIFMPNAKARAEDYCTGFGLSEHELELIRALPVHSRCFLVRHANHSVVVRLDLSGMPEVLTVLSGREASVRRLDALRAIHGDHPAAWFPHLTGQAWPVSPDDELWLEAAE
jgi:type IV secretion system protein VirB4